MKIVLGKENSLKKIFLSLADSMDSSVTVHYNQTHNHKTNIIHKLAVGIPTHSFECDEIESLRDSLNHEIQAWLRTQCFAFVNIPPDLLYTRRLQHSRNCRIQNMNSMPSSMLESAAQLAPNGQQCWECAGPPEL